MHSFKRVLYVGIDFCFDLLVGSKTIIVCAIHGTKAHELEAILMDGEVAVDSSQVRHSHRLSVPFLASAANSAYKHRWRSLARRRLIVVVDVGLNCARRVSEYLCHTEFQRYRQPRSTERPEVFYVRSPLCMPRHRCRMLSFREWMMFLTFLG